MDIKQKNNWIATEKDIDVMVQRFGDRLDEQFAGTGFEKEVRDLFNKEQFYDPTVDNPMDAGQFLSFVDLSEVIDVFKAVYPRFERVKHRIEPLLKFVIFMSAKRYKSIKSAYNYLITHPWTWKRLGFMNEPNYELLRSFIRNRLEPIIDSVSDRLINLIVMTLKAKKNELRMNNEDGVWQCDNPFENCGEDAVDIRARKTDKDAEYSGYYKEYGYKVDVLIDLEHRLPLRGRFIGINSNEANELRGQLELLKECGALPRALWVDGKYATYQNIAMAHIEFGVRLLYRIQKDWVFNEKGTEPEIKKRYQRYHADESFKPGATLDAMLRFLYKKGDYEHVGSYFRNIQMESYVDDTDDFMHTYLKRNRCESFNCFLKEHLDLERNVPNGMKKVKFHISLCILVVQVIALARIQNGITEQIGRHAFLT